MPAAQHTLQFGTYTFPNQTFEIMDHRIDIDTPISDIRRKDGGKVLSGNLTPRTWRINGVVYGNDKGSVKNELRTMQRAVHNDGVAASLYYNDHKYSHAQLAPGGMVALKRQGLYEFVWDVDMMFISEHPFTEEDTVTCASGSRNNDSLVALITPGGNYPACPIFTFIAGTWDFGSQIYVQNTANSLFFSFTKNLVAGQTVLIDTALGCVLVHEGLTMIDALSHFGGNLFFELEAGGVNQLVINAPTLDFTICYQNRFYS